MARVLFVQLPPPRFCFEDPPTNIPLAAGFLSAALEATGPEGIDAEILKPAFVDVCADQALLFKVLKLRPAVVALTLYVWNVERSLFLASNIKRNSPSTQILVGGPEVTPDNLWLINHPAVDAGVFGEGESRIGRLLIWLLENQTASGLTGFFLKAEERLLLDADAAEPWDLSLCPYPYVTGTIAPSWDGTLFLETVRGCPFKCRYCYYHKAFRNMRVFPPSSVNAVLDSAYQPDSGVSEIYLMDPTFNSRQGFRDLLKSMALRRESSRNIRIHTELRADLLSRSDVALFKEAGLVSAEVGLQTISREAMTLAGRRSDPEKIARGAAFLMEAGIEVTTGIILGLPGDTPEGFVRTCEWLKHRKAYSVVHPFVLSVLPGTEFRAEAERFGITYHPRPPYYVRQTATFSEEDFRSALLECENLFDMELDYIPPPSLVDNGPGVTSDPAEHEYISKWIIDLRKSRWSEVISEVIRRGSDPFTFWFRGRTDEEAMVSILRRFANANPHACIHVVLELAEIPRTRFFQNILDTAALPDHYLNRAYSPLYGQGAVVSLNFWIVMSGTNSAESDQFKIQAEYESVATVIWEIFAPNYGRWCETRSPLLVSGRASEIGDQYLEMFAVLRRLHGDRVEEVLFRDSHLHELWLSEMRSILPGRTLPEKVLWT